MNKKVLFSLVFLIMSFYACEEKGFTKPKQLIGEKEMVDILYDIHIAQAMAENYQASSVDTVISYTSDDFYQAVLDKYELQDSVLAKSIIYYSSRPKIYEKIYEKVIEKIMIQQENMENMTIAGEEEE